MRRYTRCKKNKSHRRKLHKLQKLRKSYKSHKSRKRNRGGGYADGPAFVAPGYLIHQPYGGPGKDCTGDPLSTSRSGYIFSNPVSGSGLPGLRGGRRYRGGMAYPSMATIEEPLISVTAPAGGTAPTGETAPTTTTTTTNGTTMSMPGVSQAPEQVQQTQKGGRYGFFPVHLNEVNGQGLGEFGRIPCERGTMNPLNANPNSIQSMTTAPDMPPYHAAFRGGRRSRRRRRTKGGAGAELSSAFPVVNVGAADSMRYYAPTAGYDNKFMTFQAPSPVPGLTIQTPYDARSFNQACLKTGGRRRGGGPVALNAGPFGDVTIGGLGNRNDFDGTMKGLPVKFGGRRRRN